MLNRLLHRRREVVPSPYLSAPECWWQVRINTKAIATFMVPAGEGLSRRQFRVTADLPLMLQARSVAVAQSRIPEILCGLSSDQLMLSADLFAPALLPDYASLVEIQVENPEEIWLVEASPVEDY